MSTCGTCKHPHSYHEFEAYGFQARGRCLVGIDGEMDERCRCPQFTFFMDDPEGWPECAWCFGRIKPGTVHRLCNKNLEEESQAEASLTQCECGHAERDHYFRSERRCKQYDRCEKFTPASAEFLRLKEEKAKLEAEKAINRLPNLLEDSMRRYTREPVQEEQEDKTAGLPPRIGERKIKL